MNRRSFLQKIVIGAAAFGAGVALDQRVEAEHFGPQLHSLQSTPVTGEEAETHPGIIQGEFLPEEMGVYDVTVRQDAPVRDFLGWQHSPSGSPLTERDLKDRYTRWNTQWKLQK